MKANNVITGYVYTEPGMPTEAYHCVRCGQILMVLRGHTATWTSGSGIPYQNIAVTAAYLEHVCPRCHSSHQILVQSVLY